MGERPISVLLLARDETGDLEELLPTLDFAREVVLVWDPRGDRSTRAAAERLGARVFDRTFDGFGPQRQFALEHCTQEWVLWLDPDERLDARARALLGSAELTRGETALRTWAATLRRASRFLGAEIRFCGWRNERVLRFFRRCCARFDGALVHERVVFVPPAEREGGAAHGEPVGPEVGELDAGLVHFSYRTIADCETKLRRYAEANAEKAWRSGRRAGALDVALRPVLRFLRQYLLQLGALDGEPGLRLCWYAARQVRMKYALLRRYGRERGRP